jgi:RNA recognition motif-containing protein
MLPETLDQEGLASLAYPFGTLQEAILLRKPNGRSRGCGFVVFSSPMEAQAMIRALHGQKSLSHRPLVVRLADRPVESPHNVPPTMEGAKLDVVPERYPKRGPQKKGGEGCNLFVMGFPHCWTDRELSLHFQSFGDLVSATVFLDLQTQRSRGFGFVSYRTSSAALLAQTRLNGSRLHGKRLLVKPRKCD